MGQAEIQEAARPSTQSDTLDRADFPSRARAVRKLADGRSAWLHDGSCMSRETHVQFCESLRVRLPGATHPVLGFQHRADAEQFLRDWKERLGRFGLELHPDKTRLIEFGRYAVANRKERGEGKPETFNFLGFTHICGQTWKSGKFLVLRKTIHQRLSAKVKTLKEELRRRKHLSVAELGKWLSSVVQGYFNYHAVP